jgi:hypothetical protein
LEKAYDMAWRHLVVKNIFDYGLKGNLSKFISAFLTDRKICIRIGHCVLTMAAMKEGILQGSVLLSTCFIVAINGITDNLPNNVKHSLYATYFPIYCSGSTPHLIDRKLQVALNCLTRWTNTTGFAFSVEKTKIMHFCRRRNCARLAVNFTMNNQNIRCVPEHKYLGLQFDNGLI